MPDENRVTLPRWLDAQTLIMLVTGAAIIVGQWYVLNDKLNSHIETVQVIDGRVDRLADRLSVIERSDDVQAEKLRTIESNLYELRRQASRGRFGNDSLPNPSP